MRVIRFSREIPKSSDCVLLILQSEEATFRGALEHSAVKPFACYVCPDSYTSAEILCCLYYLKYLHDATSVEFPEQNLGAGVDHVIRFFSCWEQGVAALRTGDPGAIGILKTLKPVALQQGKALEFLFKYCDIVLDPLRSHSPFLHVSKQSAAWFKSQQIPHAVSLSQYLAEISAVQGAGAISTEGPIITQQVTGLLDNYTEMTKSYPKAFNVLSAFAYSMAGYSYEKNMWSLSYLLCHRCLDLFFQGLAFSENIITSVYVRQGSADEMLVYQGTNNEVYLIGTEFQLQLKGIIPSSLDRRNCLVALNTGRNQLLYTHGPYAVSRKTAKKALTACKTIIEDASDAFWGRYCANFSIDFSKWITDRFIFAFDSIVPASCVRLTI